MVEGRWEGEGGTGKGWLDRSISCVFIRVGLGGSVAREEEGGGRGRKFISTDLVF